MKRLLCRWFLGHKWETYRDIDSGYVMRMDCSRCGLTPYEVLVSRARIK